jgi:hypothetical protein
MMLREQGIRDRRLREPFKPFYRITSVTAIVHDYIRHGLSSGLYYDVLIASVSSRGLRPPNHFVWYIIIRQQDRRRPESLLVLVILVEILGWIRQPSTHLWIVKRVRATTSPSLEDSARTSGPKIWKPARTKSRTVGQEIRPQKPFRNWSKSLAVLPLPQKGGRVVVQANKTINRPLSNQKTIRRLCLLNGMGRRHGADTRASPRDTAEGEGIHHKTANYISLPDPSSFEEILTNPPMSKPPSILSTDKLCRIGRTDH